MPELTSLQRFLGFVFSMEERIRREKAGPSLPYQISQILPGSIKSHFSCSWRISANESGIEENTIMFTCFMMLIQTFYFPLFFTWIRWWRWWGFDTKDTTTYVCLFAFLNVIAFWLICSGKQQFGNLIASSQWQK